MLTSKQRNLKPLLESMEGVHLTVYLVNRTGVLDLKGQLRAAISEADEWLKKAMAPEERIKFLEPLESLLKDSRIFKQMSGNVGIFRNETSFRVLNIPIQIESSCQVATSFHVKPLLRWLQGDRDFLLLGLEKDSAHLYMGSQASLKLVDTVLFPEFVREWDSSEDYSAFKKARKKKQKEQETFTWLNSWILELTKDVKPSLFMAGEPSLVKSMNQSLKYKAAVRTPVAEFFSKKSVNEICGSIRRILNQEAKMGLEKALLEFRLAEEGNRAKKNIFQISRAVVQGRVRKLIVTDELSIFGKIDPKSGGLAIHPVDLDHEDDCILDDLAQMVLSQGGEVVVAKRDEIPKGRPILAILDDENEELELSDSVQRNIIQERFG